MSRSLFVRLGHALGFGQSRGQDPHELREAVDGKLKVTRAKRWSTDVWRAHLKEIDLLWEATLLEWLAPDHLPPYEGAVHDVEHRLRQLRLG